MEAYKDTANWNAVVKNQELLYYEYKGTPPNGKPKIITSIAWPAFAELSGGSRRRTVHRKRKSYHKPKSKRVHHTRRKQSRRHRHSRRRHH